MGFLAKLFGYSDPPPAPVAVKVSHEERLAAWSAYHAKQSKAQMEADAAARAAFAWPPEPRRVFREKDGWCVQRWYEDNYPALWYFDAYSRIYSLPPDEVNVRPWMGYVSWERISPHFTRKSACERYLRDEIEAHEPPADGAKRPTGSDSTGTDPK